MSLDRWPLDMTSMYRSTDATTARSLRRRRRLRSRPDLETLEGRALLSVSPQLTGRVGADRSLLQVERVTAEVRRLAIHQEPGGAPHDLGATTPRHLVRGHQSPHHGRYWRDSRALTSASGPKAHPFLIPTHGVHHRGKGIVRTAFSSPHGYTPAQIRHAYGFDQVSFNGVTGDGRGRTIAIVDAYDDPKFVNSTDPAFSSSDLHRFDAQFGLPDPIFTKVAQDGTNHYPGRDSSGRWEGEIALDVEWAHAIAPGARILLVEANSADDSDLYRAVDYARSQPGVTTVSMSWGRREFSGEASYDSHFQTPSGHAGVTFVASSGDYGAPPSYPAISPNVLAVGGTKLQLDTAGNYLGETGWSRGSDSWDPTLASGGGISQYELNPSYQNGTSYAKRTNPDVAYDADPNTGFAVYDTYNNGTATPWDAYGGTSAGAPQWAALIAIADQGRASIGMGSLDGTRHTLPLIYQAAYSAFHDITTGNNGFAAGLGFDLVTGRGSPLVSRVIAALVPKTSPRTESGFLIQSGFGQRGNFETVVPLATGGLAHYWRDNDAPGTPWHLGSVFGQSLGHVDAVSLIESDFSASGHGPGNLELVARVGDRLAYFWEPDNGAWQSAGFLQADGVPITGVAGTPAMIQGRFGGRGNFETVVPLATGGLTHYWRDNDAPGTPWHLGSVFGQSLGHVDAVSLIESDFSAGGGFGNLEVVATVGSRRATFWRGDQSPFAWTSGSDI